MHTAQRFTTNVHIVKRCTTKVHTVQRCTTKVHTIQWCITQNNPNPKPKEILFNGVLLY